jgi:N-acetylmuramoyl-L-alanine amidase
MLLTLFLFGFLYNVEENSASKTAVNNIHINNSIILDAGHGGFDGGASASDGTQEKDINLSITLKLKELLEFSGYNVILTRDTDSGIESNPDDTIGKRKVSDMKNRLKIINSNPEALFVSIHLNKFTTASASGAQVFYSPNNENSMILAENLQKAIVGRIQPNNDRVIKKGGKNIYLLKNAKIPSVIVECGFLSNKAELEQLKSEEYQLKMAFCIYCGILDYNG